MKTIIKKIMLLYMNNYWGERCNPRMIPELGSDGAILECPLCKARDCFDYLFPNFD